MLLILLSVVPTCFHKDIFITESGYSTLWLIVLYLVGGYIKLYNPLEIVKKRYLLLAYLVLTLITWCPRFVVELLTLKIFGQARGGGILCLYTSPTVLLASIALVILFSKIRLKKTKIISLLASVSFGVYIIHENRLVRPYILTDMFVSFANLHWAVLPFAIIGMAIAFYIVCGIVEYIRIKIFDILKIKKRILNLEIKLTERIGKL